MKFCLVSEKSVPDETVSLLRDACEHRGIPFETVEAKTFGFDPSRRLSPGDMLYRAAVSAAASRAEQFLFTPGVAALYTEPNGVYFGVNSQTLLVEAAGVPIPATVYIASGETAQLRAHAAKLGGFPLVLKVLGKSSGIGVMLAESMRSLKPMVDFLLSQGHNPLLSQFIPEALHWRIVVLGDRVIASYRNKRVADDFRSAGPTDRADFNAVPPRHVAEIAIRATQACGLEFAGVDVLEDPVGKAWFLEANFPCYYPHAQVHAGVDIAGAMVDFLRDKARGSQVRPVHVARPLGVRIQKSAPERLAAKPVIRMVDQFAAPAVCEYIIGKARQAEEAKNPSIRFKHDSSGFSFEMPIQGDAVLTDLREEIHHMVGMTNDLGFTFRFRRYEPGESHRPHLDEYEMAGRHLVATAILYLTDTDRGGETSFPKALPEVVRISPKQGRLAIWHNYRADGTVDPCALHESLAVQEGVKATVTYFLYRKIAECADVLAATA